jgi:hypothetical protein
MTTFAEKVLKVLDQALIGPGHLPDQDEVLAQNQELRFLAKSLRVQLASEGKQAPSAPKLSNDDCLADNEILRTHVAELQGILDSKPSAVPASKAAPVTSAKGKPTLTERVLAAKGVKTLDELPLTRNRPGSQD